MVASKYKFSMPLKIRVGDINYGNHVGHETFFSFFQEARIAYLDQFGFSEFDIGGCGMMISEANCRYRQELNFGDDVIVRCSVSKLKTRSFTMDYQILRGDDLCAVGFTIALCYDYREKKIVYLPQEFVAAIHEFEGMGFSKGGTE